MDQLKSLLDSIAPEDQPMARMLLDEVERGEFDYAHNGLNRSEASCRFPGYQAATPSSVYTTVTAPSIATPRTEDAYKSAHNTDFQTGQSFPDTAPAPTNPCSEIIHPEGWDWAHVQHEDDTKSEKWCTVNSKGGFANIITVLVHFDHRTGIQIMLALPDTFEEATKYWVDESNRSHVTRGVANIMNTLKLTICRLEKPVKRKFTEQTSQQVDAEDERFLTQAANSLAQRFKLDTLSVTGSRSPYDVVFRQANEWDDIVNGHRYADQKTLVQGPSSTGQYTLGWKKANQIFEEIKSCEDSRMGEA